MNLHYIQHVPFEGIGHIQQWADDHGIRISSTQVYKNDAYPDPDSINFLVIMGGPMAAYDEDKHPWMKEEKAFIRDCVNRKIKVIGFCLGAQLIASALGAKVYPGAEKEIGWWNISLTTAGQQSPLFSGFPSNPVVYQWHGDTFDLPENAILLASSSVCKHQAFQYKNALALQFHLETTEESMHMLIDNCADELVEGRYIQNREEMLANTKSLHTANRLLTNLLERFVMADNTTS